MIYIKNNAGEWGEGAPSEQGQPFKEVFDNGGSVELLYSVPIKEVIHSIASATVQVNGNAPEGLSAVYFGKDGDSLSIELDIVDSDGVVQTQIDQAVLGYPPVLALPIVKTVGTSQAEAELYLTTTITNGHMVATIVADRLICGNWVLLESRVNEALAEIGADWKISMDNISFRML